MLLRPHNAELPAGQVAGIGGVGGGGCAEEGPPRPTATLKAAGGPAGLGIEDARAKDAQSRESFLDVGRELAGKEGAAGEGWAGPPQHRALPGKGPAGPPAAQGVAGVRASPGLINGSPNWRPRGVPPPKDKERELCVPKTEEIHPRTPLPGHFLLKKKHKFLARI